jgi:hypothetical protein
MYIVFGTLILILACSCGPRGAFDNEKSQVIYQIIQINNRKLAKNGLYECMNGGGVDRSSGQALIDDISEGYKTTRYHFKTVEEARPFFCKIVEEFLQSLNADGRIAPLMKNFPLTVNDIEILIRLREEDGDMPLLPYLSGVNVLRGIVSYEGFDENCKFVTIHREPYEEAIKICQQSGK